MSRLGVVAGVAAAVLAGGCGGGGAEPRPEREAPAAPRAQKAPGPVAKVDVDAGPGYLTAAFGLVWVGNHQDNTIQGIDPGTNRVVRTFEAVSPVGIAAGFGSLWTFAGFGEKPGSASGIVRLDPESGRVRARIARQEMGGALAGFVKAGGAMWTAGDDGWLTRIDPRTDRARRTLKLPEDSLGCAGALAVARRDLWYVPECGGERILRIDPRTSRIVGRVKVASGLPQHLVGRGADLWALTGDGVVLRVDTRRNRVIEQREAAPRGDRLALAGDTLWVRAGSDGLVRLDAETLERRASFVLPQAAVGGGGLVATGDDAWAANFETGSVWRFAAE